LLPASFGHAWNFSGERKLTEADAAKHKLSDVAPWPTALEAAVAVAAGKFRFLQIFCNFGGCGHI
jgi:hypothetical protein